MNDRTTLLLTVLLVLAPLATRADEPVSPSVTPSAIKINLDGTYDSNVSASSAAIAAARGLIREDETLDPSAAVNYFHQLGLQSLFFDGEAGYSFYRRNHILNRERISMSGGITAQLEDCRPTLQGSYGRRQSDLQDLDFGPIQNTEEDISETLSSSCNQTGKLVPSFSLTNSSSNNSALLRQTSNYKSLNSQASLLYNNHLLGKISLVGQYVETSFPHRIQPITGTEDGYKLYAGGVHLEHDFGETITLLAGLSHTSVRSDGGTGVNFDGLTYDATVTYKPTSRLEGHVEFSRQTNPSNRLNASYSIDQELQAEMNYQLTSQFLFKAGASNTRIVYQGAALIVGTNLTRETRNSYFGSLSFDISPRTSVNLTATRDQTHADVATYSYHAAIINLSISRTF